MSFDYQLLWRLGGKASVCQCRRHRFDPWVGKIPWRKKWQSTPVFLPGKSYGQRSLVSYSPWGHKESDMTVRLTHTHTHTHTHTRGSCCVAQGAQISALWWPIGVGLEGDWKVLEGGDICIHKVGSLPCTAETNTRRKAIILQVLKIPLNPTISWILSAWE